MISIRDSKPSGVFPIVTIVVIALNCVIWLQQFHAQTGAYYVALTYGLVPWRFLHQQAVPAWQGGVVESSVFTVFTYMFMHSSFLHLLVNMCYLGIFGKQVEGRLGHVGFAVLYTIFGVGSALAHIAVYPSSQLPVVGASGAISGILGVYLFSFPRGRIRFSIGKNAFEVPAFVLILLYMSGSFLLDLILPLVLSGYHGSSVGHVLHAGGLLLGALVVLMFTKTSKGNGTESDNSSCKEAGL